MIYYKMYRGVRSVPFTDNDGSGPMYRSHLALISRTASVNINLLWCQHKHEAALPHSAAQRDRYFVSCTVVQARRPLRNDGFRL